MCREVALKCLQGKAFPPVYPMICRGSRNYCCTKDFCNSDAIYREKFSKGTMTRLVRHSTHLWACENYLADTNFGVVCCNYRNIMHI